MRNSQLEVASPIATMTHSTYQMQTNLLTRAFMLENKYLGRLQDMSFYYICKAWEDLSNCRAEENISGYIHALFCNTVRLTLSKNWSDVKLCDREKLRGILASVHSKACRTLAGLLPNPWGHDTVAKVVQDSVASNQKIGSEVDGDWFLRKHICTTNCYSEPRSVPQARVELLCHAGYKNEALRLCLFYHHCPILCQDHFFAETALHLLYNMGKIKHMIDVIQTLTCHDGFQLVQHILNNSNSTIQPLVECLVQILLVRDLVGPSPYCCTLSLMKMWCWLHFKQKTRLDTVILEAKKLGALSSTSAHLYLLVDVLYEQFGRVLLPLYLTLYVHALTIDINNLEYARQVDCRVAVAELETHMSGIYVKLASLLSTEGKTSLARECLLTAFSLEPTVDRLTQLQRYSAFQTPLWRLHNITRLDPCVGECYCIEKGLCRREPQVPPWYMTHVPNGILDSTIQGVSQQLLHDLCILVEGPRCRWLSWNIPWESLCTLCLSYLQSARELRAESDDKSVGIEARLKRLGPFHSTPLQTREANSHLSNCLERDVHLISVVEDENPCFENSKDDFNNCVMDIIVTENVVSVEPNINMDYNATKGPDAFAEEEENTVRCESANHHMVHQNIETTTAKSVDGMEPVMNKCELDSLLGVPELTKDKGVDYIATETQDVINVPTSSKDENALTYVNCAAHMASETLIYPNDEKQLIRGDCSLQDDERVSTFVENETNVQKNISESDKININTLSPSCAKATTSPNMLRTCRIVLEDISHKLPNFGNLISSNSFKASKLANEGNCSTITNEHKPVSQPPSPSVSLSQTTKKESSDNDKKCHVTTTDLTTPVTDSSKIGQLTVFPSIIGKQLIPFVVIDKLDDRHILSLTKPSDSDGHTISKIRTKDYPETVHKKSPSTESTVTSVKVPGSCLIENISNVDIVAENSSSLEKRGVAAIHIVHSVASTSPEGLRTIEIPTLSTQVCDESHNPVRMECEGKTYGTLICTQESPTHSMEADASGKQSTSMISNTFTCQLIGKEEQQSIKDVKSPEQLQTSINLKVGYDEMSSLPDKTDGHIIIEQSHGEQVVAVVDSAVRAFNLDTERDSDLQHTSKFSLVSQLNGNPSVGKTQVGPNSTLITTSLANPVASYSCSHSDTNLKHRDSLPCIDKSSNINVFTNEVPGSKVTPFNKHLASSTAFENLVAETLDVRGDPRNLVPFKDKPPIALTLESLVAETLDISPETLASIKPSCVNSEDNSEIETVDDNCISTGVIEYPVVGNSPTPVVLDSTDACQIAMSTYGGACDLVTLPLNVTTSSLDVTTKPFTTSYVPNEIPSLTYVTAKTSCEESVLPAVTSASEVSLTPGSVSVTFLTTSEPHSAVLDHMYTDPKHIIALQALSPKLPQTSQVTWTSASSKVASTHQSHTPLHSSPKVETASLLPRTPNILTGRKQTVMPHQPVLVTLPTVEKTEVSMISPSVSNAAVTPSHVLHALPLTNSTVSQAGLQQMKPSFGNIVVQQNSQQPSQMELSQLHNGHALNVGVAHIQIDPLGNMQIVQPSVALNPSPSSQVTNVQANAPLQMTHAIHIPLQSPIQTGKLPVCASAPVRLPEKNVVISKQSGQNTFTVRPRSLLQTVAPSKVVFRTPRPPEVQLGQHVENVNAGHQSLKYFVKPVSTLSSTSQQVVSMKDSNLGMLKYAQKIPSTVVSDGSSVITVINKPVTGIVQANSTRPNSVQSLASTPTQSHSSMPAHSLPPQSVSTTVTSGNMLSSSVLSRGKQIPLKLSTPAVLMTQPTIIQRSKSSPTSMDHRLTSQQNLQQGMVNQPFNGIQTQETLYHSPSELHVFQTQSAGTYQMQSQTRARGQNTSNQESVASHVQMTGSLLAEALLRSGSSKLHEARTLLPDANSSSVVLPSSRSVSDVLCPGKLEFKAHIVIPESRSQVVNNRKVVFTQKKDRKWVSVRSAHGVMGYRKADNEDPKLNNTAIDNSQSPVVCSTVTSIPNSPAVVVAKTVTPSSLGNSSPITSLATLSGATSGSSNIVVNSSTKSPLQTIPLVKKCHSPAVQSLNINRIRETPKFAIFSKKTTAGAAPRNTIQSRIIENRQPSKHSPTTITSSGVSISESDHYATKKALIEFTSQTTAQPFVGTVPVTTTIIRNLGQPKVVPAPKLLMLKSIPQSIQELPAEPKTTCHSVTSSNSGNMSLMNGLKTVNLKPSLVGLGTSSVTLAGARMPSAQPTLGCHKLEATSQSISALGTSRIKDNDSQFLPKLGAINVLPTPRTNSISNVQKVFHSKVHSSISAETQCSFVAPTLQSLLPSESQQKTDMSTHSSLSNNLSITDLLDELSPVIMTVPSVSLQPTDSGDSSSIVEHEANLKEDGSTIKTCKTKTVKKTCPHCHKVLSTTTGLRKHLLAVHDIDIPRGEDLLNSYIQRPTPARFAVSPREKHAKKSLQLMAKMKKGNKCCSSISEPSKELNLVQNNCERQMPDLDLMETRCELPFKSSENSSEATRSSTSGNSDHQKLGNCSKVEDRKDPESFLTVSETLDSINSTSENEFVCSHATAEDVTMPLLLPEVPTSGTESSLQTTRGRVSSRSVKLAQKRSCPCCENTSPNSPKKCRGNKIKKGNSVGRKGVTIKSPRKM